tara:strand:+ start:108 stop:578 length:471 start_codon:yes stop_codon:yes gene_type:complete
MSSNIVNQIAYLRTSREFPEELHQLSVEVNKMYVDIAGAVNERTIGLFPVNRPAQTGNSYYILQNRKQQTLRQVYTFTATTAIDHNIKGTTPGQFINCFGSYTDGTNTYGLFFATSVAIAGQITFYITPTQIVFVVGGGAPALTSGIIVLEWLSQP